MTNPMATIADSTRGFVEQIMENKDATFEDDQMVAQEAMETLTRIAANINSRNQYLSRIRKAFRIKYGERNEQLRDLLEILRMDKKLTRAVKEQTKENLEGRKAQPIEVSKSGFESILDDLKDSPNWYDHCLLALAATGRRSVEMWKTGIFEPVPNNDMAVRFSGQVKLKDAKMDPYVIPLQFIDFNQLKVIVEEVRSKVNPQLSKAQIQSDIGKQMNNKCKAAFRDVSTKISPHKLRAIWLAYIAEQAPDWNILELAEKLFGHQITDADKAGPDAIVIPSGEFYVGVVKLVP